MFLKNVWHVAAWSHEIPADGLLTRRLLGERIVFYRDSQGVACALRDRCPHRAAPLSMGRREGDTLRCMYHGLVFNPQGVCIHVPGTERVPPGLDVRAYPLHEQGPLIWIWMGDPALADPSRIEPLEVLTDPDWFWQPGYLHYPDAGYLLIMDNLLDFSHLGFVHENTLGGSATSGEVRAQVERLDWGLRITRKYVDDGPPPFLRGIAEFTGPADRWQIYEWRIGGNLLIMESGVAPAGSGGLEGRPPPEAVIMRSVQALTPETEEGTHYFFLQAHNMRKNADEITATLARGVRAAFLEDKTVIEGQQRLLLEEPDAPMGAIPADAALNQGRWLLNRMLEAEAQLSSPR